MDTEGVLDAAALEELDVFSASERSDIAAEVLRSLSGLVPRLTHAIAAGSLADAAQLAHSARNDALLVGARRLGAALQDLERHARSGDASRAGAAMIEVQRLWPTAQAAIEKLRDAPQ